VQRNYIYTHLEYIDRVAFPEHVPPLLDDVRWKIPPLAVTVQAHLPCEQL
jgi:hypothetical protein